MAPYREAPRSEQAAWGCFYCGSQILGGKCPSCMAEAPRSPGAIPTTCRRCGKSLVRNTIGFGCSSCGGLFIPGEDWDGIVETIRGGGSVNIATIVPPPPGSPQPDKLKPVSCASCGGATERVPFGARSGVLVDVCARHGIWLDSGELVGVLEFVRRLWANSGQILTPDEQREADAVREYHRVTMEHDKKVADEREEIERLSRST